jgi:hypothetical protein
MKTTQWAILAVLALRMLPSPGWAQHPELNVLNFGAACDGRTDDAGPLQAAFNALPVQGGTVLIPCRIGIGSAGARLTGKTNVTVRGVNGGGFRALAVTNQDIVGFGPFSIAVDGCANCVIRDLVFEQDHRNVGGLGVTRSTDTTVENVTIRNTGVMTGGALSASGNKRNRYIGNTIDWTAFPLHDPELGTRGMWLGNPEEETYEWEPYVAKNHVKDAGHSCIASHAINDTYVENLAENCAGAGFKINPIMGLSAQTLMERNIARRNRFHGLQTQDGSHFIIRHNLFELNADAGIFFGHGQTDTVIHNNIIRNNDTYVGLRGLPDANTGWMGGILLQGGESNIEIRDNVIEETRSGSAKRWQTVAMRITSISDPSKNIRILRNTCIGNTVHGIYVEGHNPIEGLVIAGNICSANAQWGIHIEDKLPGAVRPDVQVCGNLLTGNGAGAILTPSSVSTANRPCPVGLPQQPGPNDRHSDDRHNIVITAYGTPHSGAQARMELHMGGKVLAAWTVTASPQQYSYTLNQPLTHKLRVHFTNDAWSPLEDRNLFVPEISIDGWKIPASSPEVYSQTGCHSGHLRRIALYCNGYFEFPLPPQ